MKHLSHIILVVEYYLVKMQEAFRPLRDLPSPNFNGAYDETML